MWSSQMTTKLFLVFFMICASSLLCLSCAIPNDLREFSSEEQVLELFQEWQSEHGRVYPNPQEEAKRFQIFQSNLKHIKEKNAKRKSGWEYRLGLNKFADLSAEEFRKTHLHAHTNNCLNPKYSTLENHDSSQDLPDSIDWREKGAVTEVKEQGNCESHWAFAVVGGIEGINAINRGELVTLSAQQLIDCDPASNGCGGGYYFNAFGWVIDNGGIDTEANYPYTASNGICKNGSKVVSIDKLHIVRSESGLLSAVSKQPVTTSVDAVDFQLYSGGIYGGDNCEKNSTYASLVVLVVGYGSENGEDYWIVKNSWGKDWGENGYIRIKRNSGDDWPYGVCAIYNLAGYPSQLITAPSLFQA